MIGIIALISDLVNLVFISLLIFFICRVIKDRALEEE